MGEDRLEGEACSNCTFYSDKKLTSYHEGRCTKHPRLHQKEDDGTDPSNWCMHYEAMLPPPILLTEEDQVEDHRLDVQGNTETPPSLEILIAIHSEVVAIKELLIRMVQYDRERVLAAVEKDDPMLIKEIRGAMMRTNDMTQSVDVRLQELQNQISREQAKAH